MIKLKKFREYGQVVVSNKGSRWLESKHPWLYESDVVEINGQYSNGDIVDVLSLKGKYLGSGFISDKSKIRVRLLSDNANEVFDRDFFKRRITYAFNYRNSIMANSTAYRLIFGESDQLPGLTVDRYNDILVTQIVSYGMEKIKDMIFELLVEVFEENDIKISAIYQRNDLNLRKLEGLEEYKDYGYKCCNFQEKEVIIEENGLKYYVDYKEGQKTGFFLDQKYNRYLIRDIVKGKKVLDCFTHTGSFALNAAKANASKVVAMDISEKAIEMAKRNAKLNKLEDKISFEVGDTFDYLDKVNKKEYDVIILDPPAFTKSKDTQKNAFNGYKNINMRAMSLLPRGGFLITCSCSHFMDQKQFEEMLKQAALLANVQLKIVSFSQQSKDHPILMNVPETNYLKFYILQVI